MARSVEHYQQALLAHLPKGDAWPRDLDSELGKMMCGAAEEFTRIEKRSEDLLNESHPSQVFELFDETEKQYGLPDHCLGDDPAFQKRRATLIQKYQMLGGQSREFFIAVAAALGYAITITEYQERLCGDQFGDEFGAPDCNFIWQVNAQQTNYSERYCGDSFGSPYRAWGNQQLECVLNALVHSHRHIIYRYT